jgi:hypothetical protein
MRILTAQEGMTYTNSNHTIFGKEIYLGCEDSPDNYFQIADQEAENIINEQLLIAYKNNETLYN